MRRGSPTRAPPGASAARGAEGGARSGPPGFFHDFFAFPRGRGGGRWAPGRPALGRRTGRMKMIFPRRRTHQYHAARTPRHSVTPHATRPMGHSRHLTSHIRSMEEGYYVVLLRFISMHTNMDLANWLQRIRPGRPARSGKLGSNERPSPRGPPSSISAGRSAAGAVAPAEEMTSQRRAPEPPWAGAPDHPESSSSATATHPGARAAAAGRAG